MGGAFANRQSGRRTVLLDLVKREADKPVEADAADERPVFKLGFWRVCGAVLLILLSLVSSVTIAGIELAGGATLAALAALILLWPLIPQLWSRGGDAEFLGLKIKLNALERRSEEELGVRIEEVSADLEAVRLRVETLSTGDAAASLGQHRAHLAASLGSDEKRIREAIKQYESYPDTEEWDSRVAVDKRLIAAGPFDVSLVLDTLEDNEAHREIAMTVAVALGTVAPGDLEKEAVETLARLINHRSGRVRYRAARSSMRWLRRKDLQLESRFGLVEAARARANVETLPGVHDELIRIVADYG